MRWQSDVLEGSILPSVYEVLYCDLCGAGSEEELL